jgi:hypothetical protein
MKAYLGGWGKGVKAAKPQHRNIEYCNQRFAYVLNIRQLIKQMMTENVPFIIYKYLSHRNKFGQCNAMNLSVISTN